MANQFKIITIALLLSLIFSLSLDIVYAGSPPPPPPPCDIKSPGCYRIGDIKSNFGELSLNEFSYFISENKCKRTGGCDCRGVPDNIPEETDPDQSSGACTCIASTDWNAKARCCGDDEEDCGKISSGVICNIDANAQSAQWIISGQNPGEIRYVGCSRSEHISDGTTWIKCDGTFWRKTISNSEFICIGRGRESLIECCGDGSCKSRVDGKRLSTGQSVNPASFSNEQLPPPEAKSSLKIAPANPTIVVGQIIELQALYGSSHNSSPVEAEWTSDNSNIAVISDKVISCTDPSEKNCFDFQTAVVRGISAGTAVIEAQYDLNTGKAARDFTKVIVVIPSSPATGQVVGITGNAVSSNDNKTYYCGPDRKFTTDLDVPNPKISDTALIGRNRATCEKAGLVWTGTKCCSEDDDPEEHYNDISKKGGCWDEESVISINFVEDTNESVINYDGQFHGCAIGDSDQAGLLGLLWILDKHTGGPLIKDENYCTTDTAKTYYCSFSGQWKPTDGADRSHLSFAPVEDLEQEAECCAQKECWDGEKCTANQKDNPLAQPINGSRCIDGEWAQSDLKSTPDGETSGYCPKMTQCLSKSQGQTSCIESSEYTDDNYCESGQWSTRTKLLALKLLEMKSGDYTLLCDSRENALNNLQYLTSSNEAIANVLNSLQTNNFCVLKAGNKIITAASLNKNIEEAPSSSLNIFGVTSCNNALIDDGQYHSCDGTNKVWYNKRLKSLVYSSTAITVPLGQAPFEEALFGPIKSIIESIQDLIGVGPSGDKSYVNAFKRFDKLHMSQQGTKSIKGSIEGKLKFPFFKNSVIEYKNIDADICKFVEQYTQAKPKDDSSGISCTKDGSNYYILAQGSQATSINPEAIWLDLTSKLRLK